MKKSLEIKRSKDLSPYCKRNSTNRDMAERHFPNDMPNYLPEITTAVDEAATERSKDSLANLLSLPYNRLSERLKTSALELKHRVGTASVSIHFVRFIYGFFLLAWVLLFFNGFTNAHQVFVLLLQVVTETWELSGKRVHDYTVYTGALGTAYLLFKAYQATNNENDLKLCSDIVRACDSASRDSG